jgi:phage recombination protein Bet
MPDDTALAVHAGSVPAPVVSREQIDLIKKTIAKDATDLELQLFLADNARLGVHPFDRMLHFTKRGGKYVPIIAIDFARSRAAETGDYVGNADPRFTYAPGSDVPTTATATVWRIVKGEPREFSATARMKEYRPPAGQDIAWQRMPHIMLGKCAEMLALRKGFPRQLGGLYESGTSRRRDERDPAPPPTAGPAWAKKPSGRRTLPRPCAKPREDTFLAGRACACAARRRRPPLPPSRDDHGRAARECGSKARGYLRTEALTRCGTEHVGPLRVARIRRARYRHARQDTRRARPTSTNRRRASTAGAPTDDIPFLGRGGPLE